MKKLLPLLACAVPFMCSAYIQIIPPASSNSGSTSREKYEQDVRYYNDFNMKQEQLQIQRQMLYEQQKANRYQQYGR